MQHGIVEFEGKKIWLICCLMLCNVMRALTLNQNHKAVKPEATTE